ncbi:MAG: hypothetical protein U0871_13345 [Gemmataceae bacterium]
MRYTVVWRDQAQTDLTTILNPARDKQTVFRAARAADRRLTHRPLKVGESRDVRYRRVAYLGWLYLVFVVDRVDHVVFVERVRWIGPIP